MKKQYKKPDSIVIMFGGDICDNGNHNGWHHHSHHKPPRPWSQSHTQNNSKEFNIWEEKYDSIVWEEI